MRVRVTVGALEPADQLPFSFPSVHDVLYSYNLGTLLFYLLLEKHQEIVYNKLNTDILLYGVEVLTVTSPGREGGRGR